MNEPAVVDSFALDSAATAGSMEVVVMRLHRTPIAGRQPSRLRRQSLLSEGRLKPDGGKNKDACYESHPNWDEVGPPLTTFYLSIMKVYGGCDKLTRKI